mmetsp:Transcript_44583/g.80149  ORF Transcript_44583/g.80149 Transcript_44583/m.80149 type:complete len:83 (-) Transcript_44583:3-251(-)
MVRRSSKLTKWMNAHLGRRSKRLGKRPDCGRRAFAAYLQGCSDFLHFFAQYAQSRNAMYGQENMFWRTEPTYENNKRAHKVA